MKDIDMSVFQKKVTPLIPYPPHRIKYGLPRLALMRSMSPTCISKQGVIFCDFFYNQICSLMWCPKHLEGHDYLFVIAFSKASNHPKAGIRK